MLSVWNILLLGKTTISVHKYDSSMLFQNYAQNDKSNQYETIQNDLMSKTCPYVFVFKFTFVCPYEALNLAIFMKHLQICSNLLTFEFWLLWLPIQILASSNLNVKLAKLSGSITRLKIRFWSAIGVRSQWEIYLRLSLSCFKIGIWVTCFVHSFKIGCLHFLTRCFC